MTIQAISADGAIHEFPDETPDSVINGVMKSYAAPPSTSPVADFAKEGLKQIGGLATSIAGETPESRQFESALSGVMEGGMSPDEAAQLAPVPPTQPEHGGFARGLVTEISKGQPEAAASFLEGFSNDAPEAYKPAMLSAAQKIRDYSKNITPENYKRLTDSMYNIKNLGDAWNYITETAGQSVGSTIAPLVLGTAGGLTGTAVGGPVGGVIGGTAGVFGGSYVQNYDEIFSALKDAGLDPKTAHNWAKWGNIPIAALDTGSFEFLVSRFGGVQAAKQALIHSFVDRVKQVVKEGVKVGGVEAGTEAAQDVVKDAMVSLGADKPFLTQENLKGIAESAAGGFIGGVTMGSPAGVFHAPAKVPTAPTEQDVAAAGAGIVAPPAAPAGAPAAPTAAPTAPTTAAVAPTAAAIAPTAAAAPTTPPSVLGQRLASIIEPMSDSVVEPSINPLVQRGQSFVSATESPIIASGPVETRPGRVEISPEQIDAQMRRAAGPEEKVALPAIEYNGMLFPGALHMEAVGSAMQKLGVSEDQVIDSPTFKEGFITTDGRFISREEAAQIAERHSQYESYFGSVPEDKLFAENLKTLEEPGAYRKAFAAVDASQAARGLRNDITPEMIITKRRQLQLASARKEGKSVLPYITVGQRAQIPALKNKSGAVVQSLHSTTVGQLIPSLDLSHFTPGTVQEPIAKALVNRLASTIPDMPIHILLREDMNKASSTADGIYYPSNDNMLHLPDSQKGPIFVSTNTFGIPGRFAEAAMHESVHAMTSDVVLRDPVVRERVTKLLNAAKVVYGPAAEKLHPFLNEREFITGTFTNEPFQEFLLKQPMSKELWTELGLDTPETPRPLHAKLWDGVMGIIQHIFRLPGKPQEVKSMLEAAVRIGVDTMEAQKRLVEQRRAMQAKFDAVEPELKAVPRQEATRGAYDMVRSLKDYIPGPAAEEMARQLGYADKMNWFYKYTIHAFQLGELNPHLAELQRLLEKFRFAMTDEAGINDARIRVTKDWANLGKNMSERMVGLIDDITNMVYRTQSEIQRGIGRKPTQQEFNTLVRKHGVNAAGLQVVQKINKIFDTFLDKSADLARQQALKIVDPVARADAVDAVNQNVANLKSRPYFPFMRYGRHVVTVQNQAGRVIHREHFERRGFKSAEAMQKDAMKRLERAFPAPLYTVKPDILSESSGPMVGMPGIMLDMMAQKLNLSSQQLKALDQLKFEVSPAQSFRHRFQNKSYTAGYSKDFKRSFAQYFFHGAKWYVKAKYADGMRADIKAIHDNALSSLTPIKRVEIARFLERHLEEGFLNPVQDFSTIKAGLVLYTLAYVPISAAVNMSQVPMQTLPHLAGKFGSVQASKALLKAMATWKNYYRKGNLASMTSDEARALSYAIKTQRLEQTMASELASWGQGGNLMGFEGNSLAQGLHSLVEKGMWTFSMAEKWNRRITFSAARELALAQPNSKYVREVLPRYVDELKRMMAQGFSQAEAEATLVATHAVDQTQGMTGQMAKPQIMRGKYGTLFMYKRYVQNLLFWSFNNKRDVMPKFIITALLMAGLHAIPGYDDLAEIARVLGYRLFGKDFSADREVRKLMDALGTDEYISADQVLHGSARIGFGVPWLLNMLGNAVGQSPTVNQRMGYPSGPDLSASIAPGTILPVEVGKLLGPPITSPAEAFAAQSARAGGVMGQLAYNFYQAIASKDDLASFKRWELAMPRAAKLLTQAYRAYSTGEVSGKNETAIVRFDTRDPEHLGEILGMAGGARPRRLTAQWEELRDQNDQIKFIDVNRGMILEQWVAAVRSQDPKELENMRIATQEFNANLPTWARGMGLKSETIQQSVGMRLKTQVTQEAGFAIQRGRIPLIQEIQRLHPESTVDVRRVR